MQGVEKANILGCGVDMISMAQSLKAVEGFISAGKPHHIITLNAEIIYAASRQQPLRRVINQADLVTPDGAGVVWAARFLGHSITERVTGIDLTIALAAKAAENNWKLYLLGSQPGIAARAAENMGRQFPGLNIAGTHHGYFKQEETDKIVADIRQSRPQILLVALGAPNQEFWINRYLADLEVPVAIGVGGSLDVLAGVAQRAPDIFIKLNLEWLYRLLKEPNRWRRQTALPRFVWQVIRQKIKFSGKTNNK